MRAQNRDLRETPLPMVIIAFDAATVRIRARYRNIHNYALNVAKSKQTRTAEGATGIFAATVG